MQSGYTLSSSPHLKQKPCFTWEAWYFSDVTAAVIQSETSLITEAVSHPTVTSSTA